MFASYTQVGGIYYDFNSNTQTASVTYKGVSYDAYSNEYSGSVVIPSSVTYNNVEYSVTSIGEGAFQNCSGLTAIEIPNSVTSIGNHAFDGCRGLTSIEIPNSVTNIGNYAFSGCSGLTSIIEIPNSVTSIGYCAFDGCSGLTSIEIPNSVTSIGNSAFSGCSSLTSPIYNAHIFAYMPKNYSGAYSIPDGIESIAGSAFSGCTGLTSIEIPNSVTNIGNYAFSGCSGLTSVTIGNSVTSIGEWAFYGCSGLTSVTIPNSVTSIGWSAFSNCSSLTSVTIPNSVTSIGERAFYNCTGLTSVTIPESVTSIGENAFLMIDNIYYTGSASGAAWGALHMNNEIIPLSTSQIISITSKLSSNQTSEEYYQFTGVISSIREVNTSYGNATFYITDGKKTFYCYRIYDHYSTLFTDAEQLSVGDSVVISSKVQNYRGTTPEAVQGRLVYHSANPLFTPDSIMYYGKRKDNNSELKLYSAPDTSTLNIPETVTYDGTTYSVTEIAPGAMYKHKNIKCVVLPKTLKLMPKAFELCDSIETLYYNAENLTKPTTIPFVDSKQSLKNVYIGEDVETIPEGIFNNLENITEVTIPNTTTYIGKDAFHSCIGLATLYLGENISTYGDSAFAGCSNLTSIYNYRERPAKLGAGTFDGVDYFNCTLYVLANSVNMYKSSGSDWRDFYFVEPIGATSTTTDEVVVTPHDNTADIVWPTISGAASYELEIKDVDGNLICTLIFNANGQLTSLAFHTPSRYNAPEQTQTAGFAFTITGLEIATRYTYTMQVKDASSQVIAEYSGTFGTTGATEIPLGINNISTTNVSQKIMSNGQILILRGNKTYTTDGRLVR